MDLIPRLLMLELIAKPVHGVECVGQVGPCFAWGRIPTHYSDVIMSTMASQITSVSIICSTVSSGADQRKHQSSASVAFVGGM